MTPERWWDLWSRLCKRFHRDKDQDEAALYLEYLDARLTAEQIEEAVQAVWATREFFPRPVDFVLACYTDVLVRVREAIETFHATRMPSLSEGSKPKTWVDVAGGPDSVALTVIRQLGGITAAESVLERGAAQFRREVEAAVHRVVVEDAKSLPQPDRLLLKA